MTSDVTSRFPGGFVPEPQARDNTECFADPVGIQAAMAEGYGQASQAAIASMRESGAWNMVRDRTSEQDKVRTVEQRLRSTATMFLRSNKEHLEADRVPVSISLDWYRGELASLAHAEDTDPQAAEAVLQLLQSMLQMAAEAAKEYGKPIFAAGVEGVVALLRDAGSRQVAATMGGRVRALIA